MQAQHGAGRDLDRGDRFLAGARPGIDAGVGAVAGIGKLGDGRLGGGEFLPGIVKQLQRLVQSLYEGGGIGLAHLLHEVRAGARHPGRILKGPSGQGLRQNAAIIADHGERFRKNVRQVRNAGDRRIVVGHADGHGLCVHHLGHAHDIGESLNPFLGDFSPARLTLGGVIVGNAPRGAAEKPRLGVIPPRFRGTRHGVPSHVAILHAAVTDLLAHGGFHGDYIRDAAARGVFLNGIQDAAHRGHGNGDHNERLFNLGAVKHRGQVIIDVKPLLDCGAGGGRRVVVSKYVVVIAREIAQQGTTDEAEADNADGALNILRTHGDNCGTTRLISRGMSNENYSFAVTVARNEGQWAVRSFDDDFEDPQTSITAVRSLRSEGAAFALLCVEDAYFIAVRPVPGGVKMLISDATYGVDDDFAADFMELNDYEIPDVDPEEAEPYGEGDFDIFADLGLSEDQVGYIIDDEDDWPSDMLLRIAGDLGFGDELEDVIDNA